MIQTGDEMLFVVLVAHTLLCVYAFVFGCCRVQSSHQISQAARNIQNVEK